MSGLGTSASLSTAQKGMVMARVIDPESLDKVDVRYLQERPWMIEEYERQGLKDQMAAVRAGMPSKDDPTDITRVHTTEMALGNIPPQIESPRPDGVTDEEGLDDDYESWTKEDLLAEIDARNEEDGRTNKLPKSGSKADLALRLHQDDAVEA